MTFIPPHQMATHPLECPTKSRPYEYCSVGLPAVPLVSGGAIDTRGFGAVGDTVVGGDGTQQILNTWQS